MTTYSDGGIYLIDNSSATILPLRSVSRLYAGQGFHIELLNRGTNLITVYWKPLLGNLQTYEIPTSSPGVVLDNLPWTEFANGLSALADTSPTNLMVKLYSNYLWKPTEKQSLAELYPRDTFSYPKVE